MGYRENLSPKAQEIIAKVYDCVENLCIPADPIGRAQLEFNKWEIPPLIKELRRKTKASDLFKPHFLEIQSK
jgi:hypothetical protein